MGKKIFYTERDIEDLCQRGVTTLEINDDVVITDLAREVADKRGLRFVRANPVHPADRPHAELIHRVKAAVRARLGDLVDDQRLEAAIQKVLGELNL